MLALHYKYKRIERGSLGVAHVPYIPVTIRGEQKSFDVVALLDSGADVSLIPLAIAESLKLKLENPSDTKGVGGVVKAYETKIEIAVGRGREIYRILVPAKVLAKDDSDIPMILGREGFFTRFAITFDQANRRITLKRNEMSQ